MESNREYFRRRAGEESLAAAAATCEAAREVHWELQRRFEKLAQSDREISLFLVDMPVERAVPNQHPMIENRPSFG